MFKKKKLIKLKEESKKQKVKIRDRLLKHKLFYRISLPIKGLMQWFNNLSNSSIVITVLLMFVIINMIVTWSRPLYSINAQTLSAIKNKGFRGMNVQVLIVLYLLILNFLDSIWYRYMKKPMGTLLKK